MKCLKKCYIGLLLGLLIILLFLIHTIFFRNEMYFKVGYIISCFVIPAVFTLTIVLHLLCVKKKKKFLHFKDAFQNSYIPQLIAGFISIGFIFIYFNYIDVEARDTFNYQRAEINYQNAKLDIENSGDEGFKNLNKEQSQIQEKEVLYTLKEIRDTNSLNFFSFNDHFFIAFLFAVNVFYIIISLFLSLFLRNTQNIK